MGDMIDQFREAREFKRAARRHWHECPSPGCQFGGNPVKVPPGGNCRHCNWQAPGEKGSDRAAAEHEMWEAEWRKIKAEAKAAEKKSARTCRFCSRHFNTPQGRASHERDVHAKLIRREGQRQ